jgi:hypothetical protein
MSIRRSKLDIAFVVTNMNDMPNAFESEARARKVARIVAVLPRGPEAVAALEGAGDDAWRFVAQRAGVKVPSLQTRACVLETLRGAL